MQYLKSIIDCTFLITDVKYTSLVENVYPLIQTFIRNKNCHYAPGVLAAIGTFIYDVITSRRGGQNV